MSDTSTHDARLLLERYDRLDGNQKDLRDELKAVQDQAREQENQHTALRHRIDKYIFLAGTLFLALTGYASFEALYYLPVRVEQVYNNSVGKQLDELVREAQAELALVKAQKEQTALLIAGLEQDKARVANQTYALIQTGSAQCDMAGRAPDVNWTGMCEQQITFAQPFSGSYEVMLALTQLDPPNRSPIISSVRARTEDLSRTGFTIVFETARRKELNSVAVSWIAFPKANAGQ